MLVLFLHGGEILAFFGSILLGLIGFIASFALLWNYPPRHPLVPALIYLILALLLTLWLSVRPETMLVLVLPTAFWFPWSVMSIILATALELDSLWIFAPGSILNALLIFGIGKLGRKHKDRTKIDS